MIVTMASPMNNVRHNQIARMYGGSGLWTSLAKKKTPLEEGFCPTPFPLLGPSSQRLRAKDIEPMTPFLPLGHCDSEQDGADALSASARTRACPCKSGHTQFASCTRAATWLFPPRRPGAMGDLRGQECAPHARL